MRNTESEKTELQKILQSYKLTSPVDKDIKDYIDSIMGKQFKEILKRSGDYSFFTGAAFSLCFFLKRNGLLLSILKYFSAVMTIVSITMGTIFLYNNYSEITENNKNGKVVEKEKITTTGKRSADEFYYSEKYSLKVMFFDKIDNTAPIDKKVSNIFQKELKFNKKTYGTGNLPKVRYLLTGSIMQLDNGQILFVKVINVNNSEIIYTSSNKVSSQEGLLLVSKKVAGEISRHLIK